MTYEVIKSETRGYAHHGWLEARHTFSFAEYYDPSRVHFGVLRVINDDLISPSAGFPQHPHRDMEIITIVLRGQLAHKDSMGNSSVIRAGEVQVMSAGTGVLHSEYNASSEEVLNLFQIWVLPDQKSVAPRYDQKPFPKEGRLNSWQNLVQPFGENLGGLSIHQNSYFWRAQLDSQGPLSYDRREKGAGLFVFVVEGSVVILGENLENRDAICIRDLEQLEINSQGSADLLLIEVPLR